MSIFSLEKDNILYGSQQEVTNYKTEGGTLKTSVKEKSKYSHEDVEEACREANAFDFISELPQTFATECGKKVIKYFMNTFRNHFI